MVVFKQKEHSVVIVSLGRKKCDEVYNPNITCYPASGSLYLFMGMAPECQVLHLDFASNMDIRYIISIMFIARLGSLL